MKRIYILLTAVSLFMFRLSTAGEIYVETTVDDNVITLPIEAKEYLESKKLDYNLDPSVHSPLGNFTGATIKYKPNDLISTDSTYLLFSLQNAYISPRIEKCWLVFYEHNGLDTNGDGIGETSYDLNKDGDTHDSFVLARSVNITENKILFRTIEFFLGSYHPQSIFYLACSEPGENYLADINRYSWEPPSTFDTRYNLVLNMKKTPQIILRRSSGDDVCIKVSRAFLCCPSEEQNGLLTEEKCFMDFKQQFYLDMEPKISYIDSFTRLNTVDCSNSKSGILRCYDQRVEPHKRFVDESSGYILDSNSCTDELASSGIISLKNNPDNDIEDPIILSPLTGWRGSLVIKFYDTEKKYSCNNTAVGYKALDFRNDRIFIDNNGSPNSNTLGDPIDERGLNDIPFVPGEVCEASVNVYESGAPSSDTLIAPQVTGWRDDVYIGVDGTNKLEKIKWGLSLNFSIYDNDDSFVYSHFLSESSESILKKLDSCCYELDKGGYFLYWKPNGDEAYIPYMLNTNLFRVIVSNNSCWDAEIYARVWDEKGRVVDNVYIGVVKANSVRVVYGNEIFSKARKVLPELGKGSSPLYSTILTVSAPKRDVEFAAYDFRNGKSKMIPVYDLGGSEKTYRNVNFVQDPFDK